MDEDKNRDVIEIIFDVVFIVEAEVDLRV